MSCTLIVFTCVLFNISYHRTCIDGTLQAVIIIDKVIIYHVIEYIAAL